jgi:hypothetical protein
MFMSLPRLFGALAASSIYLVIAIAANASQLACRLYSTKDATELIETIKISVDEGGAVSVWKRGWREKEERKRVVLGHWMSAASDTGAKFSVVVIEARFGDQTYPPYIYFVDWGNAKLAEATVPYTLSPVAQIDTRWECNRLD